MEAGFWLLTYWWNVEAGSNGDRNVFAPRIVPITYIHTWNEDVLDKAVVVEEALRAAAEDDSWHVAGIFESVQCSIEIRFDMAWSSNGAGIEISWC